MQRSNMQLTASEKKLVRLAQLVEQTDQQSRGWGFESPD